MKLGKLSLVAVMALGTSAFAIDNVKVSGEAKLWYQTTETEGGATAATTNGLDFFEDGANSSAHVKLSVGATADLLQNLSAGVKVTALSTLGLENNLVGSTFTAKIDADGTSHQKTSDMSSLNDQAWVEELWLAYTAGKTTAKVGRQRLDTPLAFSEDWNAADNTFEAAVLLNNDLPDTTLVGAWVGKHNGVGLLGDPDGSAATYVTPRNTTVAYEGKFGTFGTDGAYAVAAINKSIPNTTVQAWYYNVCNIADAYWLQADTKVMGMINLGAQYASMNPDNVADDRSTDMFALKASVDVYGVNVYGAYSSVSDGTLGFANVATGDKTMMYTGLASVYFDGEIVSAPDTDAWKIGASTKMVPGVTLLASYGEAETGNNGGIAAPFGGLSLQNYDYEAWDIVAKTKAGPVDLTAIYTEFERNGADATKSIDNALFRLIASLKF